MGHQMIVNGEPVQFPYKLYPAQVALMHSVMKSCSEEQNSMIESPTGTGKSMALLCASLAWQSKYKNVHSSTSGEAECRYAENDRKGPRIIYCSRTHSQLAQVVSELKKQYTSQE